MVVANDHACATGSRSEDPRVELHPKPSAAAFAREYLVSLSVRPPLEISQELTSL